MFLRGHPQLKRSPEPYYSNAITHQDITINLLEEDARDPSELLPTTQWNRGSNTEGTRESKRNATIQQSPVGQRKDTHLWTEGGGVTRGVGEEVGGEQGERGEQRRQRREGEER